MEKVIVAFESEKSCRRVREVLESGLAVSCLVCRTAAEVKRTVNQQDVAAVVCGYKFPDQSAGELFQDLRPGCAMLMVAGQGLLELCGSRDILKLAAPVRPGELTAAVEMLLRLRRTERDVRPTRSREETELIARAKAALMERRGLTEAEAHRWLQKRSMDTGARLADAARAVLEAG